MGISEGMNIAEEPERVVSKRVVLADVPPERKPERGYVCMLPRNGNRTEGTFACSCGTKTGTRVHSPKPPFYETALLSPSENIRSGRGTAVRCTGPEWSKMKMTLLRTDFAFANQSGPSWFVYFGLESSILIHLGSPTVLWPLPIIRELARGIPR